MVYVDVINFSLIVIILVIFSLVFHVIKFMRSMYYYWFRKDLNQAKNSMYYLNIVFNIVMSLELAITILEVAVAFSFYGYACFGDFR